MLWGLQQKRVTHFHHMHNVSNCTAVNSYELLRLTIMIILCTTDEWRAACTTHDNVLLIDLLGATTSLIIEQSWKSLDCAIIQFQETMMEISCMTEKLGLHEFSIT